jgi:hypothetical protein
MTTRQYGITKVKNMTLIPFSISSLCLLCQTVSPVMDALQDLELFPLCDTSHT